jgi:outer membrane murein-binding lipoprotein Lpp
MNTKDPAGLGWINLFINLCQAVLMVAMQNHQEKGDNTIMGFINKNKKGLTATKMSSAGMFVLLGAGISLLLKRGNKMENKVNQLNTDLSQVQNNVAQLETNVQDITNQLNASVKATVQSTGGQVTGGNVSIDLASHMAAQTMLIKSLIDHALLTHFKELEVDLQKKVELCIKGYKDSLQLQIKNLEIKHQRLKGIVKEINANAQSPVRFSDSSSSVASNQASTSSGFITRPASQKEINELKEQLAEQLAEQKEEIIEKKGFLKYTDKALRKIKFSALSKQLQPNKAESDSAAKTKSLKKDDDSKRDPGAGTSGGNQPYLETNFLFVYTTIPPITKLNNFGNTNFNLAYNNKLSHFFSLSKSIKPIFASSIKGLDGYNIKKQLINLENNLDINLKNILDINVENKLDINIIDLSMNKSQLINSNKLINVVNNTGTYSYNNSFLEDYNNNYSSVTKFNELANKIKASKIINLSKNNNLNLISNENINQPIKADFDLQLIDIRSIYHKNWINTRLKSYPIIDCQIDDSVLNNNMEIQKLDNLIYIKPNYLLNKSLVNNNLNKIQYKYTNENNIIYLSNINNIDQIFIFPKLYIDFIDLLFCELFFINKIININISCLIYGGIFMPTLFILNGLSYILSALILIIPIYLINNRIDILLKNNLNEKNYILIKNILNQSFNIFFNILFLYIIFININNIGTVSNLVLLKLFSLHGRTLIKDLKINNSITKSIIINENKFLNPYIYKEKYY